MRGEATNTAERWLPIAEWYDQLMGTTGWPSLAPMADLVRWVADQPMAGRLFPCTSHTALCVDLRPGYDPERPFFSCQTGDDGRLRCELWAAVGRSLGEQVYPLAQAREAFTEFVGQLEAVARHA